MNWPSHSLVARFLEEVLLEECSDSKLSKRTGWKLPAVLGSSLRSHTASLHCVLLVKSVTNPCFQWEECQTFLRPCLKWPYAVSQSSDYGLFGVFFSLRLGLANTDSTLFIPISLEHNMAHNMGSKSIS